MMLSFIFCIIVVKKVSVSAKMIHSVHLKLD